MKRYLIILVASVGLVGCAHDRQQGGTYNESGTYQGSGSGMASDPYYNGNTVPPSADRSPGANEHSPPPVSSTPSY